eukprot:5632898-Lingulodinium_polyedra.AAC.1
MHVQEPLVIDARIKASEAERAREPPVQTAVVSCIAGVPIPVHECAVCCKQFSSLMQLRSHAGRVH